MTISKRELKRTDHKAAMHLRKAEYRHRKQIGRTVRFTRDGLPINLYPELNTYVVKLGARVKNAKAAQHINDQHARIELARLQRVAR